MKSISQAIYPFPKENMKDANDANMSGLILKSKFFSNEFSESSRLLIIDHLSGFLVYEYIVDLILPIQIT